MSEQPGGAYCGLCDRFTCAHVFPHTRLVADRVSVVYTDDPWPLANPVRRCDAEAYRGTGYGVCDSILDQHGVCANSRRHVGD